MFVHKKDPLEPQGGTETPETVYFNRRKWLKLAGMGTVVGGLATGAAWRSWHGSDEEVLLLGQVDDQPEVGQSASQPTESVETSPTKDKPIRSYYPVTRDERFEYGRSETDRIAAARYTNFYEFTRFKNVFKHVKKFRPYPWQITVSGLCRNEIKIDIDEFYRRYASEFRERQYRHRCVETWAMTIPWTGIPLSRLLKDADPLPQANHVKFETFNRPEEAGQQKADKYPWPYTEGLTLPEAMSELTLLATGVYGRPLIKQHGAPIRLVVPWQYGFKSIKSIVNIELTDHEPPTFWSTLNPEAYPFQSNVNPDVPRPWPQHTEWMLGTKERFPTRMFNGYGEYVADLYQS